MPPADRIRGIKAEQPCLFFPANGHDVDFLFRHARNHHHGVIQDKVRRPFNRAGGYRGRTPRLQIQPADSFRFFILGPVTVVKGVVTVNQSVILPPFLGKFRNFPGNGVNGEQASAGFAFFIRCVFAEVNDLSFRVPGQAVPHKSWYLCPHRRAGWYPWRKP